MLKALKLWDQFVFRGLSTSADEPRVSPSRWKSSGRSGGFDLLRAKVSGEDKSTPNETSSLGIDEEIENKDAKQHDSSDDEDANRFSDAEDDEDNNFTKSKFKSTKRVVVDPRPASKVR